MKMIRKALTIALILTLVYGIGISEGSHLRVPVDMEETEERLEDTLSHQIGEEKGYLITENGERIRIYKRESENGGYFFVDFYNDKNEKIGHREIIPKLGGFYVHLNYVYIEPDFRSRGYSTAFLDVTLKGLRQGVLTDKKIDLMSAYVRNPLVLKALLKVGFVLDQNPQEAMSKLRINTVISKDKRSGRVLVYIEDMEKRQDFQEYIENPDNADWHIFDVVDEPFEGEEYVIFADYHLEDPDILDKYLETSKTQVFFSQQTGDGVSHVAQEGTFDTDQTLSSGPGVKIAPLIEELNSLQVFGKITRKKLDNILVQIEKKHSDYYVTLRQRAVSKSKRDKKSFNKDYLIYFLMKDIRKHPEILKNASRKTNLVFKQPKDTGTAPLPFRGNREFFEGIKGFLEAEFGQGYLKGKIVFNPGCGYGELVDYFKEAGADIFAVDMKRDLTDPKKNIYHADAKNTPFASRVFDITTDSNLFFPEITPYEETDRVIEEIWRISKHGSYHFYYGLSEEREKDLIERFTKFGFEFVAQKPRFLIFRKPDQTLSEQLTSIAPQIDS